MANRNIPDATREAYLEWLMTPPPERDPATKTEMADRLNVAISTLWRWEQEPEFQEELRMLKTKWGVRFHGDILARLMDIVQNGTDTAAIQASKVLLPHLDTGPRTAKEEDLVQEQIDAITEALKKANYSVIDSADE